MRLAIIGDLHFGFQWGMEQESDCFVQAKKAFKKALELSPDAIILLGDSFDTPIPRPEVMVRAAEILTLPHRAPKSRVQIVKLINKPAEGITSRIACAGIPIIAIHGTHERRPKGQANPIEVLERLGIVIYLQANGVVLEKEGVMAAIQGIGGVPERFVQNVFSVWDPKPVPECYNLILFHQAVAPYTYTSAEDAVLEIPILPQGFDLYVDGHIHAGRLVREAGRKLLLTGSTLMTQQKVEEFQEPKKVWTLDLPDGVLTAHEITPARTGKYLELEIKNMTPAQAYDFVKEQISKTIKELSTTENVEMPLKQIIRAKLSGHLAKGFTPSNLHTNSLTNEFKQEAIVTVDKGGLERDDEMPRGEVGRLEDAHASLHETTMKFLSEDLETAGAAPQLVERVEELFALLVEADDDAALEKLKELSKGETKE